MSHDVDSREIRRVTILGSVTNLILSALKMGVGKVTGSVALFADGVHSLSDLITDILVLLGTWFGALPPDQSHPYGHGKFETFATLGVAAALVAAGVAITWDAGLSLYDHEAFVAGPAVIAVALISVVAKEALFWMTRAVAAKVGSPSVYANAWHHRSDALSSVAVLLGAVAGALGWEHGDQVAGILVGLMVAAVGARIGIEALGELSERAVDEREMAVIKRCLDEHPEVREWHRLRTRKVGRGTELDVHILVDPYMTVAEGHGISEVIEKSIRNELPTPSRIVIHIEPYDEQLPGPEGTVG